MSRSVATSYCADQMRPDVEEFAMTNPRERRGDRIDVAGVPVRRGRNSRVTTPAVLVDPGDDTMIAILEADIDGVDMRSRSQGAVQQIVALLGAKITGIRSRHLGEKAQRGFGTVDQFSVRSTPAWLVCATASFRIDTMPAEFLL